MQNSVIRTRISSLYGSQASSVVLSTQNCVLHTRIKRLYWFPPSPVVLCIQNSDFRTRITSLCGSQTSPVIFCLQNSMISIRITSLHGSQPSRVVFECKTVTLGPDLQVCMGPIPHLCFLDAKQSDLHQNDKTILLPAITCGFVHVKQRL